MLKINLNCEIKDHGRDDSQLRVVGMVQVDQEEWEFPMHSHSDIVDIVLITHGEGVLRYKNQKIDTCKGDLLVHNQDTLHGEHSNPNNPLEELCVSLTGVQIPGLPYSHILPEDFSPVVKTAEKFHLFYYLFDSIKNECLNQEEGYEVVCQDAAKLILSMIQMQINRGCHQTVEKKADFPVIMEMLEYLDINYNKFIRLEDLGERFHFSPYYLARKFKEEMGLTINQYVTNRRIGEAEKLLIYSDMPITEISRHIGYDTLNHFYAIFRKHIGVAPGRLREIYFQGAEGAAAPEKG